MKTKNIFIGMTLVLGGLIGIYSCNQSPAINEIELLEKSAKLSSQIVYPDLVEGEDEGILMMREEEKMAHDVYVYFFEKYQLSIFEKISTSETRHYDAMYKLITAFDLTDPSTGVEGTFNNTRISELYTQLIAQGDVSLIGSLEAGALIEETDIKDISELIEETENPLIETIYGNLLRGSRNHLRAFVSKLAQHDVIYVPLVLDQELYDSIISSPIEPGENTGKNNGKKKGQNKDFETEQHGNGNRNMNGASNGKGDKK